MIGANTFFLIFQIMTTNKKRRVEDSFQAAITKLPRTIKKKIERFTWCLYEEVTCGTFHRIHHKDVAGGVGGVRRCIKCSQRHLVEAMRALVGAGCIKTLR